MPGDPSLARVRRPSSSSLRWERDGHIALVTLNRPDKLNAIDGDMLAALTSTFAAIEDDPQVRAVVVRGEGRAFCAGADLRYVEGQMGSASDFATFLEEWHRCFSLIERCSRPTIAAVHGMALAGGLELTQVCDVVVASETAEFGDQHAKFGLFPGGGSTQRLPRMINRRAATWLLLSGDRFSSSTALDLGMVNRVVPPASLLDEAIAIAAQLSRCSTSGNAAIKRAIREGAALQLEDALQLERSIAVEHMLGPDAQIGLTSFRCREEPVFMGLETKERPIE